MRHVLFLLLGMLVLASPSIGQKKKADPLPNALLWKISGKSLTEPSYLYGTIHMINKADFLLSDSLKATLARTQQVAFEIDMEDMSDFSKLMPLMMKAFMSNDTTLADLYSQEEYGVVKAHFEKVGLPLMFLERIKPMFLSALGSEDLMNLQSQDEVVSYEMELTKIAKSQNKEILGLETAEFQMSMFDSIPYRVQAKMLLESIQSGENQNDDFEKMVELYKNQDINGMQELMKADPEGIGRYEELLLINRNINWIPIMEHHMKAQSTFFAVGAGHLGGEKGVIELLKAEGYDLSPIL